MLRRDWQLETLVVLVVLAASAWSQTARYTVPAASVGDDFSVYHQALDSAADLALANIAREAGNNHITGLMAYGSPQPSRAILHHFAQQYWNADEESVRDAVSTSERGSTIRPAAVAIWEWSPLTLPAVVGGPSLP
jgi:hypothetical protein